jgi:hypothetical protein
MAKLIMDPKMVLLTTMEDVVGGELKLKGLACHMLPIDSQPLMHVLM